MKTVTYFMNKALSLAKTAARNGDVPVGAIIVQNNKIIASGYNKKEYENNPIGHAEIEAIQKASVFLNSWRLNDCDMYTTLEPCSMCAGAILESRISNLFIGTMDERKGSVGSVLNLLVDFSFNPSINIYYGIMENKCSEVITSFFKLLR